MNLPKCWFFFGNNTYAMKYGMYCQCQCPKTKLLFGMHRNPAHVNGSSGGRTNSRCLLFKGLWSRRLKRTERKQVRFVLRGNWATPTWLQRMLNRPTCPQLSHRTPTHKQISFSYTCTQRSDVSTHSRKSARTRNWHAWMWTTTTYHFSSSKNFGNIR